MPSIDNLLPSPYAYDSHVPFSPPTDVVFTNALWFLSLLLSISCALMSLSLQRWVKPPAGVTTLPHNLPLQARLRTLFADRIESPGLAFLVKTLHGLVHIAFNIFLAGLLLYLYKINSGVSNVVAVWAALVLMVYGSVMHSSLDISRDTHILNHDLALYKPLPLRVLSYLTSVIRGVSRAAHQKDHSRGWYESPTKLEMYQELASYLDDEVLQRTFDMLRSDDDLEQFFEALPGFLVSEIVDNLRRSLDILGQQRLAEALIGFWDRTLTSMRVSESVKGRRLIICTRAIEVAELSITIPRILRLSGDLSGVSGLVEIGHSLRILLNGNAALFARSIIASIISTNNEHDRRWDAFVMDELEISEDLLRRYLRHGNSLLLANLIHITRKFFHSLLQHDLELTRNSLTILSSLSKFDILNTLPELQHEFCALWDEVYKQARQSWADNERFNNILSRIRGLYVALPDAHAALRASAAGEDGFLRRRASYPLSKMPDHRIQEGGGSITSGVNHSTTATSPTLPPHHPTSTVQSVNDTSLTSSLSMVESITRSPSGTGDAPRLNEEIIVSSMVFDSAAIRPDYIRQGKESSSSASTTATSKLNMEEATISRPSTIRKRTSSTISSASSNTHYPGPIRRTTSSAIIKEDDCAQDVGPTAHQQTRLTHHPGETDPSGADANSLGRHDHDSSENSSKSA